MIASQKQIWYAKKLWREWYFKQPFWIDKQFQIWTILANKMARYNNFYSEIKVSESDVKVQLLASVDNYTTIANNADKYLNKDMISQFINNELSQLA